MSTNFYLVCTSHEPYISSGEVGHNALCLPDVRHAIANKDGIVELYKDALKRDVDITEWDVEVRERNMFLVAHPNCEIAIKDEYGLAPKKSKNDPAYYYQEALKTLADAIRDKRVIEMKIERDSKIVYNNFGIPTGNRINKKSCTMTCQFDLPIE